MVEYKFRSILVCDTVLIYRTYVLSVEAFKHSTVLGFIILCLRAGIQDIRSTIDIEFDFIGIPVYTDPP